MASIQDELAYVEDRLKRLQNALLAFPDNAPLATAGNARKTLGQLAERVEALKNNVDTRISNLALLRPYLDRLMKENEEKDEEIRSLQEVRSRLGDRVGKYMHQLAEVDPKVRCACCGLDWQDALNLRDAIENKPSWRQKKDGKRAKPIEELEPFDYIEVRQLASMELHGYVLLCCYCNACLRSEIRYQMLDEQNEVWNRRVLDARKKLMTLLNGLGGVLTEEEMKENY